MAAFEDPAHKVATKPAFEKPAALVEKPSPVTTSQAVATCGQNQAAPSGAVESALSHYSDTAITPHKVKTQVIQSNPDAMYEDLVKASGLTKAEYPAARRTAKDLLAENAEHGVNNINQYAYELATTKRETHMGNWMNEFGKNSYFEKKYGMNSSHRDDLQNTQPGDGAKFHGRGLVQITGRRNYTDWTERMEKENYQHNGEAVDLVNHPELAADPGIAAHIAVKGMRDGTFTSRKMGDYINDSKTDFYNARRVINGTDHAQEIADQATAFQTVLKNHAGDYTDAMMKAKLAGLPMAGPTELSGNPTAVTPELLSAKPLGDGLTTFQSADKLLHNGIGQFDPSAQLGKYTTVKTRPGDTLPSPELVPHKAEPAPAE